MSACSASAAHALGLGLSEDLQIKFFIEDGDVALGRTHQQLCSHGNEDAVVAGGVIAQGVAKLLGHEAGIAGAGEQMLEAGQEFLAGGDAGRQAGTDARA